MISGAKTPEQYLDEVPADRKAAFAKLRDTVRKNLPKGFQETIGYGMLGYCVPHSIYPAGYHCDPKQPLPFVGLASQKNFIAVYHMGLYAMPAVLKWFKAEYPKYSQKKVDMGKSCLRFKKPEDIPYDLIAELMKKITVKDWIDCYEKNVKR
jgi:uncharacterized protein YdhG (YjbR/CyaY superfamily)